MAGGTGAIIIFDDGKTVRFRPKCERCGHVGPTTYNIGTPSPYTNISGWQYRCDQCGYNTSIIIYG